MATTPDKLVQPATDPRRVRAIRRLHAIGAKRGLSHEALREACGAASLRELSADELHRHADRLEAGRPGRPRYQRRRAPLQPGEVRLDTDATFRQRERIIALLQELGWYHGPDTLARGLRGRYVVADIATSPFDRQQASALIRELQNALRRRPAPAAPTHDPTTEVPF